MAARFALGDVASHQFGAAGSDVGERPTVAGEELGTELGQVGAAVGGDDVGEGGHGCRPAIIPSRLTWMRAVILSVRCV